MRMCFTAVCLNFRFNFKLTRIYAFSFISVHGPKEEEAETAAEEVGGVFNIVLNRTVFPVGGLQQGWGARSPPDVEKLIQPTLPEYCP